MKGQRNAWYGFVGQIADKCGCSKTTVGKVLNGKSAEVTTNAALITMIKATAAQMLREQREILLNEAEQIREVAEGLVA